MIFQDTPLAGAFVVDPEPHEDARGFFARTFCEQEFARQGLETRFVQCSVSLSRQRGTLRGLHYQLPPSAEVKLVRCVAGALYDVIVDLRPESPTCHKHFGLELTARNRRALYIPKGFAHGLQTLEDDTEVFYMISEFYAPNLSTGVPYNDPKLAIQWPLPIAALSEKDRNWPPLD